jgi:hypothetical protein
MGCDMRMAFEEWMDKKQLSEEEYSQICKDSYFIPFIVKSISVLPGEISEFSNSIDDAIQDINTLVTAPAKLAATINDIITQGQNLFNLPNDIGERKSSIMESKDEVNQWCVFHDYDFRKYKGNQPVQKMARNLVDYEAGKTIFSIAMGIIQKPKTNQKSLF